MDSRVELAAITATIFHGHSHIAADGLLSIHQVRKDLLYLELHCHHVQGETLKMLTQSDYNTTNPVHLFKFKSHSGLAVK